MDYFSAVQVGRGRVKEAVELLQKVAGPSSPVLFLKMGAQEWAPVGEKNLLAIVTGKDSTAAVVMCDDEGNAKAISAWLPIPQVETVVRTMESNGFFVFKGDAKLPI